MGMIPRLLDLGFFFRGRGLGPGGKGIEGGSLGKGGTAGENLSSTKSWV